MAGRNQTPAMAAPWIAFRPTPPAPNTATLLPGATCAVLKTAPTPVVTAHPRRAHLSSGASGGSFTAAVAGATANSAMVPMAENTLRSWPSLWIRVLPSGMRFVLLMRSPSSHKFGLPRRQ